MVRAAFAANAGGAGGVLVTGGTGAVGPALVARLLAEGFRVRVLARGRSKAPWAAGAVELVEGDVTDRRTVRAAIEGMGWAFHLAALLHVTNAPAGLAAEYERTNTEASRLLAEEAVAAGVSRLVLFSSISVYGPTRGEPADEGTPPDPHNAYATSKLQAERAVLEQHGRGSLTTAVLRLAAVYGPRVRGNYHTLVRAIRSGWFVPVGPCANRRTLVHETDVAAAALLAARRPEAGGRVYNVSDGQVHRLAEIIAAIDEALGRGPRRWRLPERPVRAAAGLVDRTMAALGRQPRAIPMLEKYLEEVAVSAHRIQRELGFVPAFDLAAGWRDALGG